MGFALTIACAAFASAAAQTVQQPIEWIAAVVNGEPIAWSELKLEMTLQKRPLDDPAAQRATLNQLIHQRLILQGAREIVLIEDWQVEREYRRQTPLLRPFLNAGASPEELRERIKNEMIAEEFIRRIVKRALSSVSEERVKSRFDENPTLYAEPAAYRLHFIDVELPPQATNAQRDTALAWINAVRQNSPDETYEGTWQEPLPEPLNASAPYGSGRWIAADGIDPELRRAIDRLAPKEWSEPIVTPLGYSIMRVAERRDASQPVLDERVKGVIRVELAALDWIEYEKERSNIWILDIKIDQKERTHQR